MTATDIAIKALDLCRKGADLAGPLVTALNPIAGAAVTLIADVLDVVDDAVLARKSDEESLAALEAAVQKSLAVARALIAEVPAAEKQLREEIAAAGPKE